MRGWTERVTPARLWGKPAYSIKHAPPHLRNMVLIAINYLFKSKAINNANLIVLQYRDFDSNLLSLTWEFFDRVKTNQRLEE